MQDQSRQIKVRVPVEDHTKLKAAAATAKRSLQGEVLYRLQQSLTETQVAPA